MMDESHDEQIDPWPGNCCRWSFDGREARRWGVSVMLSVDVVGITPNSCHNDPYLITGEGHWYFSQRDAVGKAHKDRYHRISCWDTIILSLDLPFTNGTSIMFWCVFKDIYIYIYSFWVVSFWLCADWLLARAVLMQLRWPQSRQMRCFFHAFSGCGEHNS